MFMLMFMFMFMFMLMLMLMLMLSPMRNTLWRYPPSTDFLLQPLQQIFSLTPLSNSHYTLHGDQIGAPICRRLRARCRRHVSAPLWQREGRHEPRFPETSAIASPISGEE